MWLKPFKRGLPCAAAENITKRPIVTPAAPPSRARGSASGPATMASRALKLPRQGDERGLPRQDVLRCYVPAKHMREVSAGITSH